jgi:hypothetical protein
VAALGLGWTASTMVGPGLATSVATRTMPPVAEAPATPIRTGSAEVKPPAAPMPVGSEARREPAPARAVKRAFRDDSIRAAKLAVLDPAPALELAPLEEPRPDAGEQFDGMWRTVSWDGAQSEAGQSLPHIDGLPVLRVQVQANDQGKRPLMVVAQQLSSGQVIQTIEGPASDVSELLNRRNATSSDGGLSVTISDAAPAADQAMAMQMGDRMLAITGALPSDSLRAMIRRINAEMRSK